MQQLFPLRLAPCVPPFEQLAKRGVDYLQKSVLKRLHDHSFINILVYLPFDSHQTHLRSYAGTCVGAWLLARLIIPFFHLPSYVLFTTLRIKLGLSHPLLLEVSHCICNQHLNIMGIHFLHCVHGGETMALHDVV
jgi:hypothetical protein